jgi:hypothetical protein
VILDDLQRVEEALAEKRAARRRTRDPVVAQELEVDIDALRRAWSRLTMGGQADE